MTTSKSQLFRFLYFVFGLWWLFWGFNGCFWLSSEVFDLLSNIFKSKLHSGILYTNLLKGMIKFIGGQEEHNSCDSEEDEKDNGAKDASTWFATSWFLFLHRLSLTSWNFSRWRSIFLSRRLRWSNFTLLLLIYLLFFLNRGRFPFFFFFRGLHYSRIIEVDNTISFDTIFTCSFLVIGQLSAI